MARRDVGDLFFPIRSKPIKILRFVYKPIERILIVGTFKSATKYVEFHRRRMWLFPIYIHRDIDYNGYVLQISKSEDVLLFT